MIPSAFQPVANHLWQSTLFAAVAGLLTLALQKNRAQTRYWLWLAASVKFLIPFSLLMDVGSHWGQHNAPAITPPALSYVIEQASRPFSVPTPLATRTATSWSSLVNWVPVILCTIWAIGFAALTFYWWQRWRSLRAALRTASPLDLQIGVDAMMSPAFPAPGVFGVHRPILLLPAGIMESLTPPQLKAIVAHELCHVRRHDNLSTAIHMVVEALFWFHPLVWWLGARLMEERERACDEEVLLMGNEPETYAEGILNICELCLEAPLPCVSRVTGANLRERIEEIMSNRIGVRLGFGKKIALTLAGAATLMAPIVVGVLNPHVARGQSAPVALPQFEVASVKPHKPEAGPLRASTSVEIGRINFVNVTVANCIRQAYRLKPYQVSGGPGWLSDDRYDVIAKAAGEASRNQVMLMLQALLTDRFKLTFHFEEKEMPIYSLVIAKNGPKIKEVKDDERTGWKSEEIRSTPSVPRSISMTQFAGALSRLRELDRPVVDRTGLRGVFNINLDFVADDAASPDSTGPSIFAALPEQVGLKLETTKGPVKILVIDHVERPSGN